MTKLRAPLTFADAITRVAGVIGFEGAARVVGRSDRAVRYWSEPDAGGTCTLDQAKALDLAYRAAGGVGSPILESFALQLDVALAAALADRSALAVEIAALATESAQAIAAAIAVTQPGASAGAVHIAIAEAEDACRAARAALCRLNSFVAADHAGDEGGPVK